MALPVFTSQSRACISQVKPVENVFSLPAIPLPEAKQSVRSPSSSVLSVQPTVNHWFASALLPHRPYKLIFTLLLLSSGFCSALDWQPRQGYRMAPLPAATPGKPGFTRMDPAKTGILFTNLLTIESDMNNQNLSNGSGVALGDVDGDGWCDIYFANLNGANRLYRNLGNWKFEDITESSGLGLVDQLTRGVTFADVDGNGTLDLILTFNGRGARLFMNDGKGHFTEDANTGYSTRRGGTSMALGDLDGDGSLDLYVANYGENTILRGGGNFAIRMVNGKPVVTGRHANRLKIIDGKLVEWGEVHDVYLNDGKGRFTPLSWTDGRFLDEEGKPLASYYWDFGLSVQIRDINQDGHPDIYVCNDFQTPDRMWLNDGKGHFRLAPKLTMRSVSYASMGVDFADIDRDGRLDFFDVEMFSRQHEQRLRQLGENEDVFPVIGQIDNRPLIPRNTLFWNRGDDTYAEIAWHAGVPATDWTWSTIFLDVDLDGYEDILVVNGYSHKTNDKDLTENARAKLATMSMRESREQIRNYPMLINPKIAYRNRGNLTFEDVSQEWNFNALEIAQGMALADLDNDGYLDVVMNCMNTNAVVYRNHASAPRIAVRLKGKAHNTQGINANIRVLGGPVPQMQEIVCGGRYMSCDDPMRVFATGQYTNLTIEVTWRNGAVSVVAGARPNVIYEIDEAAASLLPRPPEGEGRGEGSSLPPPSPLPGERAGVRGLPSPSPLGGERAGVRGLPSPPPTLFKDVSDLISHSHKEESFVDFIRQPLLPKRLSQLGPGVAWHDLDGDGHEDLLIGSGKGGNLSVYHNDGQGHFKPFIAPALAFLTARDQTTILAWSPAPGKTSLLVGSASYEDAFTNETAVLRFDIANGQATEAPGLILPTSVGPLAMVDVDNDGSLDLFVGGRVVPGDYPKAPVSRLYRNKGGQFQPDIENSQRLSAVGMVSGAVFSDLNGDGSPDLILACEWGPVRIFINQGGQFREATKELGLEGYVGWWNSVTTGDLDGDGRMDIIAGNWGLNSPYFASPEHPARLYYGDLNGQGDTDLLEAYDELTPGKIVPRRDLTTVSKGLPFVQAQFLTHEAYAKASIAEILGNRMASARELKANTLASMVFLNRGDHFEARLLPPQAQWSPAFGMAVADFDGDGHEDLFLAQNFFATQLGMARLDAGRALLLRGDGTGSLTPVPGQESGIRVYGEQRGAAVSDFNEDGRLDLVVSQNGAATVLYQNATAQPALRIRLKGPAANPDAIGASLRVLSGGKPGPRREIHAGSGYWSQDSAVQIMAAPATDGQIEVRWPGGQITTTPIPPNAKEVVIPKP